MNDVNDEMRFNKYKWCKDEMIWWMMNGPNLENDNDKWTNPFSEMGIKSIPMLETAEMQMSLESPKS